MSARSHAAVIGGSIAGLWAARVLADHFERVTVIDRDHFPDNPEPRKGAPQGRQLHVLLVRGQQILDQLFPGLRDEILADGVSMIHWTKETASYSTNGVWSVPFDFGYETLGCSRLLLEWHIRRRLRQNERIHFVEGRQVTGLLSDERRSTVIGVRMEAVGAARASTEAETLRADLIVDASGRESRAPEWLQALGYAAPQEIVIDAHVGYATRYYRRPAGFSTPWKSLLVQQRTGNIAHSGLIYPIEGDQFIALLVGVNVEIPGEPDAYLDFARSLPVPDVYEAIQAAEPISPIYRYQRTANQMRRYGDLTRLPEAFVLMGDAVCAFNPIFGQGMSVSALEALLLDRELRRQQDAGFALRFQHAVGKLIASPWQLATSEDARNVDKGQPIGLGARLLKTYMDHLLAQVGTDPQLGRAFFDVMHLLKPPVSLFAPPIALKVLRSLLTTRDPLAPPATEQPDPPSRREQT